MCSDLAPRTPSRCGHHIGQLAGPLGLRGTTKDCVSRGGQQLLAKGQEHEPLALDRTTTPALRTALPPRWRWRAGSRVVCGRGVRGQRLGWPPVLHLCEVGGRPAARDRGEKRRRQRKRNPISVSVGSNSLTPDTEPSPGVLLRTRRPPGPRGSPRPAEDAPPPAPQARCAPPDRNTALQHARVAAPRVRA